MTGFPKDLYRFSSFLAVLALLFGAMVTGCSNSDEESVRPPEEYTGDKVKVQIKVGVPAVYAKGEYGPLAAVKYMVEMYSKRSELHGFAAEGETDLSEFTEVYAEAEDHSYRVLTFVTDQVGVADFRIKYYDIDGNYLGSGYAEKELVRKEINLVDNTSFKFDFSFVSAADEVNEASLLVEPNEVAVDEQITLTSTWVYGDKEYGKVQATYAMEENEFAALTKNLVTGLAEGKATVTATVALSDDVTLSEDAVITVTPSIVSKYYLGVDLSGVKTTFDPANVYRVDIGEFSTLQSVGGKPIWVTDEPQNALAYPVTFTVTVEGVTATYTTTSDIDFASLEPDENGMVIAAITDESFEPVIPTYTLAVDFANVTIFDIDGAKILIGDVATTVEGTIATAEEPLPEGAFSVNVYLADDMTVKSAMVNFDAADVDPETNTITSVLENVDFEGDGGDGGDDDDDDDGGEE